MTSYNFDAVFEEAEGAGFGPSDELDAGTYDTTIVAVRGDGTSKAGDPQLGFMFKADEGSVSKDGEDASGAVRWLNLTFSEKGGKYAAADAKAMGLTSAMLNSDPDRAVERTVGQAWKIEVAPSKDGKYMNVRLKKRLDAEAAAKPKVAAAKPKPAPAPEPEEETEVIAEADTGDIWDI